MAMPNISTKTDYSAIKSNTDVIFDSEWAKSTFMVPDDDIITGDAYSKWLKNNRYYCSADSKFTCTAPGMNVACNPKSQFTRYADIRRKGKIRNRGRVEVGPTSNQFGLGMGRYYSEAIDDNEQRVYFKFGVPKYAPLLLWVSKSFDIDRVVLQNRGVITSAFIRAVGAAATIFAVAGAPLFALTSFIAGAVIDTTRFYSVKDNMYTYWATVENLLNSMVAKRTMLPQTLKSFGYKLDNTISQEQKITQKFLDNIETFLPGIVNKDSGRISVHAIALRAQAAFNRMYKQELDRAQRQNLSQDFTGYPIAAESHDTYFTNSSGEIGFFSKWIFNNAYNLLMGKEKDTATEDGGSIIEFDPLYTDAEGKPISLAASPGEENTEASPKSADQVIEENAKSSAKRDTWGKFKEYALSSLSEGAGFAVFNVDSTGSVGESFSNSFGTNPLESTFNSISAKTRNLGNLMASATDIPIVSDVVKLAADSAAKVLSSASFGLANPLLALAYGVSVSMPKVWESSSASLPRASYKFKLISPYGNAYSQLFKIYLPLSMVLAGALPRSTGNATHTAPPVCQVFDVGRTAIQLGAISDLSVTRGTSNLGFSRSGHMNAIDIDISVANLDEYITLDVSESGVLIKALESAKNLLNFSESPLGAYINTLAGVDVYTQVYQLPKVRLKLAERYMDFKAVIDPDPAAFAAMTVDKFGRLGQFVLGNNFQAVNNITGR